MWQEGEEHGTRKEIKVESEAPLPPACPVLWNAQPLATLQATFAMLAQGWGTNSGEMPKPVGKTGAGSLKGQGPPI